MRFRRIEPVLRRALRGPCALPRGAGMLVAVSGGADSTALLLGLHRIAREFGLRLHAAHLHHGLRGAAADGDLDFVRGLCARIEVPLASARWNTRERMRRRGLSGQAGLRTLRREFLERAARRCGAIAIATAHTADDQLETVLMRLMRGAGIAGLGGISARRGPWLRPLLAATRADVEADLTAAGEPWREDDSNRDPRYARTRVRQDVIPALVRAMAPAADPTRVRRALAQRVARGLVEVRSARRTIERICRRLLSTGAREHQRHGGRPLVRVGQGELALDSARLRSYPLAIQSTLLRLLWKRLRPAPAGLTHTHVAALVGLVTSARGGAWLDLPGGWVAERDHHDVVLRHASRAHSRVDLGGSGRLPIPGRKRWTGGMLRGRWLTGALARKRLVAKDAADEFFSSEAVHGTLELRAARPDEWFVPFGRRRGQRLSEFLRKQRVSRALRARPVVLADAEGILWVLGVRRSARAPLTPSTRKALWIRAEFHA